MTVEMRDHVLIEMSDGVRLSARVWLPGDGKPVPALLEYLPYRKGDMTAPRDAQRHPWYAAHGYASVRVDIRGSGDSEGVMVDEYTDQELRDAVEVIAWLAAQPWCDGSVGMFGISWGGFNSLQVAALAPEPLKAIVTVCSSDDRYADDVHYFGGAVLGVDMLGWATTMLAYTARPPDPTRVGDKWKDLWLRRLDALEPYLDTWLTHQERDEYWRRGSVCEDYGSIKAAVLAVGGWADPYRNTVFRLLSNLSSPVQGLVAPWCHQYPDIQREPGPAIGFLQETLRWWDHWLKGTPRDVTQEPALRAWMQDSVRPATRYATRPGRWVTEPAWPSPNVSPLRIPLPSMASMASMASGDRSRWRRRNTVASTPGDSFRTGIRPTFPRISARRTVARSASTRPRWVNIRPSSASPRRHCGSRPAAQPTSSYACVTSRPTGPRRSSPGAASICARARAWTAPSTWRPARWSK